MSLQPRILCCDHGLVPAEWIPCYQCAEAGYLPIDNEQICQCDICHGNGGWYGCPEHSIKQPSPVMALSSNPQE